MILTGTNSRLSYECDNILDQIRVVDPQLQASYANYGSDRAKKMIINPITKANMVVLGILRLFHALI